MTESNYNLAQNTTQNVPQNAVSQALRQLMRDCDIDTFKALSLRSKVSVGAINRLQQGHILKMQVQTVGKIARVLGLSVDDLVRSLTTESIPIPKPKASNSELQQEYDRLAQKLKHQATTCRETFQHEALQTLEPWLIQWSAAAHAAQTNPQLMASKLLPLLTPIDRLLIEWGVSPIGAIGEECDYDPALHHGMNGDFQLGDRIRIRFLGYCYQNSTGNHVLHRAKVMRLDSL
jgi:transcriptional regulator with XRE-family HTH domain